MAEVAEGKKKAEYIEGREGRLGTHRQRETEREKAQA